MFKSTGENTRSSGFNFGLKYLGWKDPEPERIEQSPENSARLGGRRFNNKIDLRQNKNNEPGSWNLSPPQKYLEGRDGYKPTACEYLRPRSLWISKSFRLTAGIRLNWVSSAQEKPEGLIESFDRREKISGPRTTPRSVEKPTLFQIAPRKVEFA